MFTFNSISPKIFNSRTGLIKEVTQWLPEYDDPRIYVIAALVSNTEYLGLPKIGSTLNSGAGIDLLSATYAAIGESVERYCAAVIPEDQILFAKFSSIKEEAIPPNVFEFYSDEQYSHPRFPFKKFTEQSHVAWTNTVNLFNGKRALAPAATVYLPYFANKELEDNIWASVSSGLACSGAPSTALLSGLYEIIERDAFMLSWLLGYRAQSINCQNSDEMSTFIKKYFGAEINNICLLDITTDLGVPTVLGLYHKSGEGLLVAASTRGTFVDAVKKTLIELAQGRITWRKTFERANAEKDIPSYESIRTFDAHVELFTISQMIDKVKFLYQGDEIDICELDSRVCRSLSSLEGLVSHLNVKGYSCFGKNLTTTDIEGSNFYVYRSLIPGLLEISNDHLWQRVGRRRIKEYFKSSNQERFTYSPLHLNPVPHPFP